MTRAPRGFTLIELLVAVSLLAFLGAILLGGLKPMGQFTARAEGQLDRISRIGLAQNFLRNALGDARPVVAPVARPGSLLFEGRSDGIEFATPAAEAVAFGGLEILALDFDRRGQALRLRWRPYRGQAADHETRLLEGVTELRLAYYGVREPGDAPEWHDTWHDMSFLPLVVRIAVRFSDGRTMPDLIVALRLAGGGGIQS